mgnify:CR=1 FL=1
MTDLFGTFGIRGVTNEKVNPELAMKLGQALATHLDNEGKVAVGYDPRTSSEMIESAITSGLLSGGCDVLRLGMVPTPVLSFSTKNYSCDAGIMITASHNPPQYNGMKFWDEEGAGFIRDKEDELVEIYSGDKSEQVGWNELGKTEEVDAVKKYKNSLLEKVSEFDEELKVVVDCASGAGCVTTPYILRELGCHVVTLNSQVDGHFPGRLPEPTSEHLGDLKNAVKSMEADLGIAHDGDADRTIMVDENGEIVSGDRVFALAGINYLKDIDNPRIVTTVATSSVMDDVAEQLDGEIERTKVGEPELVEEYKKNGADLAGEENGGVIFTDWAMARDGMMTAVQIIDYMTRTGKTLSELSDTLPDYKQRKRKAECPNELKQDVLADLTKKFEDENPITKDGLRIEVEDGWYILRPSGTEPVFRCFSEAKTDEKSEELVRKGMDALRDSIEKVKNS